MTNPSSRPMTGKAVLITGGSGGIGKATALRLAQMGASVSIIGRDAGRTATAAREIGTAGGTQTNAYTADLSSQAEVRRVAAEVLLALPRLDVLVNNVGGYWNTRHTTVDGLERTFAVNQLAPFLLTSLLLERLTASMPARVVTVASNAQALGRIDFDDLQGEHRYSGARAYNQSKLANVLFTYELARRMSGKGVTANALHPGVVSTGFGASDPGRSQRLIVPFARPFMRRPDQGAATSVLLAADPAVEATTGAFFARGKPRKSSPRSHDQAVARRLWRVCDELVNSPTSRHN
jgi:retinol dehydrogenase 14